ncbi:hypothetical protein QJS10_CPA03g02006 [Acorus calamus]|uniref:Uncharacterized protein n=1 Tax=Acorus calamus TaxID=4465 RepID=A0AAV9F6Q2_ACOCL|nr:hypothetical protein QJS10_CPA03g02006 [Acorus calamus]
MQKLQPFEAAKGGGDGVVRLLELRSRTVREAAEETMSGMGSERLAPETTRWVREEMRVPKAFKIIFRFLKSDVV